MRRIGLTAIVIMAVFTSYAVSDDCAQQCCESNACGDGCGDCEECVLSVECGKKTKECFDVECKTICIPPVRFPWQKKLGCEACANGCAGGCAQSACADSACPNGCCAPDRKAKTKVVRVLKKFEYECPAVKYIWKPLSKCCAPQPAPAPTPKAAPKPAAPKAPPTPPSVQANSTVGRATL